MKKIGFIVDTFPSSTEHFILNEFLEYNRVGVEFEIFALKKGQVKSSIDYSQLSINYVNSKVTFFDLINLFFNGNNFQFIKSQVGKNSPKEFLKKLKYLTISTRLKKKVDSFNITHLHSHFAYRTTEIAWLMNQFHELTYSFTCHAKDIYVNDKLKLQSFIKNSLFVITCTEHNKNYLNSIINETYKDKIHKVYHGIKLDDFEDEKNVTKTNFQTINIICVARLVEKKGIIFLIKAIKLLKKARVNSKCIIIGGGPLYNELYELVVKLNLENTVFFLGELSHKNTLKKIAKSDVLVLPSIVTENGDRDGLPNVIVEAMQIGTPVISTKTSAIPELIINEENGILVKSRSELEIYKAIIKITTDSLLYNKIIEKGKKKIRESLDIKFSTRSLVDILETNL